MNGAQVGVFKEPNKVGFGCFLQRQDSGALETEVALEVLGNLANKALEGRLADQQVRRLLVLPDLTQGHSSRAVAMRLLDTTGGGG